MDPLSHEAYPDSEPDSYYGLCPNCKTSPEGDGPNRLCSGCRQSFIKYPVPKWIWAFAAGILAVMILGFSRMGAYMSHSIHLAKAEKAIAEHRYLTAQRELKGVLARFPDKLEVKADMLIAAAYNHDEATVTAMFEKLRQSSFEDQELLDRIGNAISYYTAGNIDSVFGKKLLAVRSDSAALMGMLPQIDTLSETSDKSSAFLYLSNSFFDLRHYGLSKAMADSALTVSSSNYLALSLKAAAMRQMGDVDGAIVLLKRAVEINREDVSILAQLCRTELKGHYDKEAAECLKKAAAIAPDNVNVLEARSMVEFFSGRKAESLRTFEKVRQAEKATEDSSITVRLRKILSGNEIYR